MWFGLWGLYHVYATSFFVDAWIYRAGASTWLAGGDPWSAQVQGLHFAALPPSLPLLAPLALIPEALFIPVWLPICVVSAVLIVRRLHLKPVWLLFPPLIQGVLLGNPAIPAFALFVCGWEPVALIVRPHLGFAALAERRWRAVVLAAALGLVLLVLTPWLTYLRELSSITARYGLESGGGANGSPLLYWLAVAATAGVFLFDRPSAGWLASATVAAPIAYHGFVSIMPLRNRSLAAVASIALPGVPTLVAIVALIQVVRNAHPTVASLLRRPSGSSDLGRVPLAHEPEAAQTSPVERCSH
jgi:hypothetical protein